MKELVGHFEAKEWRGIGWRRIKPRTLGAIRPVDPGIGDLDQHIVGAGLRHRDHLCMQHVGPARRGKTDRLHSFRNNRRACLYHREQPLA